MVIKNLKRPWQKRVYEVKVDREEFYQSSQWRRVRSSFMASEPHFHLPPIMGIPYENRFCAECWKAGRMNDERIEIDHITPIKEGGSKTDHTNLRALCHTHHNRKTHNDLKK